VGLGHRGATLSLSELIALFRLIADQYQQISDARGNLKTDAAPAFSTVLNLQPSDEEIMATVSQLKFTPEKHQPERVVPTK
jgi:hypothetical protein